MFPKVMGRGFGDSKYLQEVVNVVEDSPGAHLAYNVHLPGGFTSSGALCLGDTVVFISILHVETPGLYSSYIGINGDTTIYCNGQVANQMFESRSLGKFRSYYPGFGTAAKIKFLYIIQGPLVSTAEVTRSTLDQNVCTPDQVRSTLRRLLTDAENPGSDTAGRIVATIGYFVGEPNTSLNAYRKVGGLYWILGYLLSICSLFLMGVFALSVCHLIYTHRMYKGIAQKPFTYVVYTRIAWPLAIVGAAVTLTQVLGYGLQL